MTFPATTNVDGSNPGPNSVTLPEPYLNQGGPNQFGASATSLNAFYGATPIAQRSSAAQTTIVATVSATAGRGFTTSAKFNAVIAQLAEICATLTTLGLWKGS